MPGTDTFYSSFKSKLVLLIVPFLIYCSSAGHGYVLDDLGLIKDHSHVQAGFDGIDEIFTTNYRNGINNFNDGLYRPLSPAIFAVFQDLFPDSPLPGHLLNILVYCSLVWIIFTLIRSLPIPEPDKAAFWTALVFAVMPIHTEVVANIKSLDELLGMTFGLLACLYFIRHLERSRLVHLLLSAVFLMLGLFSKESSITYLGVIPVMVYVFYPDVSLKKGLLLLTPLLAVTVSWLLIRHNVMSSMQAVDPESFGQLNNPLAILDSYGDQLVSALNVQLMALKKLIFPYPLLHDYSFDYLPVVRLLSFPGIALILLFSGIVGSTLWGVYKRKPWAFGLAFYGITISPVANVIFVNSTIFGERLMFTPSLGIALSAVLLILAYKPGPVRWHKLAYIPIMIYAVLGFIRQLDWKSNYTLYKADVDQLATSARANHNYGTELYMQYKDDRREELKEEALFYLNKATSIYHDYLDAWNNKGALHLFAQEFALAEQAFLTTNSIQPGYAKAYFNLGVVYQETGNYQLSADYYQQAIDRGLPIADAYYGLGYALGFLNQKEQARYAFENCLQRNPNHTQAYLQLGKIYGEAGDTQTAISMFESCLKLDPNHVEAIFFLGITYLNSGNQAQGLRLLQSVQERSPGYQNVDKIIASITGNTND